MPSQFSLNCTFPLSLSLHDLTPHPPDTTGQCLLNGRELKAATFSLDFAFLPTLVARECCLPLSPPGQWDTGRSSPHCAAHLNFTVSLSPFTDFHSFSPLSNTHLHPEPQFRIPCFLPSLPFHSSPPLTPLRSPLSRPGQRLLGSSVPAVTAASCRLSSTGQLPAAVTSWYNGPRNQRNRCNL